MRLINEAILLRTCPKTLKNLHDSSLEIFNKTQWFLQKPSHLVICELSSNSNIVKFLCEFPHLEVLGQVLMNSISCVRVII